VQVAAGGNSWSSISDVQKKENFQLVDGDNVLGKIMGFTHSSWNYIGQDPARYRHYGPMAQEFHAAFGHDGIGVAGDDTTLASADVDGILFVAVQALAKRSAELKATTAKLEAVESRVVELEARLARLEQALSLPKELTQRVSDENGSQR
jgi:hypothetical protein